jgi:DNA-binding response OmpR family regulator
MIIKKRILICDDDVAIVEMLELVLDMTGAEILTETNSLMLYDRLILEKPDLLIMDLWMPVISGDELLKKIRVTESIKFLPVMIISASTDGKEIAMKAGADRFMAKPFDIDNLIDSVNNMRVAS